LGILPQLTCHSRTFLAGIHATSSRHCRHGCLPAPALSGPTICGHNRTVAESSLRRCTQQPLGSGLHRGSAPVRTPAERNTPSPVWFRIQFRRICPGSGPLGEQSAEPHGSAPWTWAYKAKLRLSAGFNRRRPVALGLQPRAVYPLAMVSASGRFPPSVIYYQQTLVLGPSALGHRAVRTLDSVGAATIEPSWLRRLWKQKGRRELPPV
jgi:hypothetical protein